MKSRKETSFVRQLFRGLVKIMIFGIVVGLVWYVTRLPFFTISEVRVEGGDTISPDIIKARVEDELRGTYLLIVPKRFSYLYPEEGITASVTSVPKVKEVHIARPSRNRIEVSFIEYIPHALGCRKGSDECWFIDSEGYAFSKAPSLHGGSVVRHYLEQQAEVELGQAIPYELLYAVDVFLEKMAQELKFRVASVLYKENGDVEFHLHGGGMILTSRTRDLTTTYENLRTVLSAPEFKHIKQGNFNYVDVRFENKIFVKEEMDAISSASTTLSE